MTQDEVIEMAQECGLIGMRPHLDGIYSEALEAFAKLVAEKERDKVTKERDRMCEQCKWRNYENSTINEANQSKILGKS